MAGFGRRELERRIHGERLAEFVAAGADAIVGAMDEGEMLEGGDLVFRRQAALEREIQAFRRRVVVAVLELLEARAEGIGFSLGRAEDRSPDGMPGLRGREGHAGVGGQRLAEILAARSGAAVRAVDEREVLVRFAALQVAQPQVERALQALGRGCVLTVVVLADAVVQGRAARAQRRNALELSLDLRAPGEHSYE